MEQGPSEPHAGRSTFLLSFGGAGGYYGVAFGTGPITTENQFPCHTLVACLFGIYQSRQCLLVCEFVSSFYFQAQLLLVCYHSVTAMVLESELHMTLLCWAVRTCEELRQS